MNDYVHKPIEAEELVGVLERWVPKAKLVKEERPSTRVVVITSVYKDARYRAEALRAFHVDEYLSKPIKPDDLRAVVRRHLSR